MLNIEFPRIPPEAQRSMFENSPEHLMEKQSIAIKEQTVFIENSLKKIEDLNIQVADLQQQLKDESSKNAIALQKEHRFTICCSLLVGLVCAVISGAAGVFIGKLF